MSTAPAYVWRGGQKLLNGQNFKPGEVLDDEFVMGLRSRDALLSAGIIKIESVEKRESPKEEAPAPADEVEDEPKPVKKAAAKKAPAKKVKAEPKTE